MERGLNNAVTFYIRKCIMYVVLNNNCWLKALSSCTASEMTYAVSSGALNSTPTNQLSSLVSYKFNRPSILRRTKTSCAKLRCSADGGGRECPGTEDEVDGEVDEEHAVGDDGRRLVGVELVA